jgi:thiol-disulfide isomerase/thioredoxin
MQSAMPASGTTYGIGDVFPSMRAPDRYGNLVDVEQFYGTVTLIDFSAGWCGPCQSVAESAEMHFTDYRTRGFVIVHAMIDDYRGSGTADRAFLGDWADQFGLTFPVLGGGNIYSDAYYGLYAAGLTEGYIPFMVLLDTEHKIDSVYTGGGQDATIMAQAASLLP